MNELLSIPYQQVEDRAGEFNQAVFAAAGDELFTPSYQRVPAPGWNEICHGFNSYTPGPDPYNSRLHGFNINPHQKEFGIDATHKSTEGLLAKSSGLRVTVGTRTKDGKSVLLPGIVLESDREGARIGCLSGPDAVKPEDIYTHAERPLTDIQQSLLESVWALSRPNSGQHTRRGPREQLNLGEIGHAVLIGTAPASEGNTIHERVHTYAQQGMAQTVAQLGNLSFQTGSGMRNGQPVIIRANQAQRIIVAREHQVGSSLYELGVTAIGVGVPMAALHSQTERSQPDLRYNTEQMIAQPLPRYGNRG